MAIDSDGGGNGYISGYTNYRIIFASFLEFQKAKSSRSQQKRNNDRTVWTGTRSRNC